MASEDVGKILENKEKLIIKVCIEAMKAHKSSNEVFKVKINESEAIFSFGGSWELKDWYGDVPFGAKKINRDYFPSLRSIGNDEAAIVNEAFEAKFLSISNQDRARLQRKVDGALRDKKQVVFTGHSSGGPIAALATIWFLENSPKQQAGQTPSELLCVTFGSPLLGNHVFSQALRREKWSRHFVHFVTRLDVVPRLLLSPLTLASRPHIKTLLERLLESVNPKKLGPGSSRGNNPDFEKLFMGVIEHALTLTSHVACKLMESTNPLLDALTSFVDLSPYRPFGNYVFIGENENFCSLNNSEAVLQFLFFSCQPSDEEEAKVFAGKIVGDHLAYEDRLKKIRRWNIYDGTGSDEAKILEVIENSEEQFGLSQRGRLHLLAAGESEKQKLENLQKIEGDVQIINGIMKEIEGKVQIINKEMKEIENYKRKCKQRNIGYFESFKLQKTVDDFHANISRLKLAGIWDEILEMLKSNKLPDDFEAQKEWIERGTSYRRLVEPLDIANYYRHLKNEDTGNYMGAPGKDRVPRPKRYRFPQKWLEHADKLDKDSCGESNFWAELEDLSRGGISIENFDDRARKLQKNLLKWNNDKLIDDGVFLSNSTFVKWWELLDNANKVPGIENLVQRG